jgi:hypothetical protein
VHGFPKRFETGDIMITLLSTQTVIAGREAEHMATLRGLWEKTWSNEPGVVRYEHYRGQRPRQYYSLLAFRDFEAFLQHQLADYHHGVDLLATLEAQDFQVLDPLLGANSLEASRIPAIESHMDALRRYYAEMLPNGRPGWWDSIE